MKQYETPVVETLVFETKENIANFGDATLDWGQTVSRNVGP